MFNAQRQAILDHSLNLYSSNPFYLAILSQLAFHQDGGGSRFLSPGYLACKVL